MSSINEVALPWSAELGRRARGHVLLALAGTSTLICLFFVGYFYVQQNPAFPVTVMPLTRLDRMIPFQPHALWIYLSLWIYVGAGPGLQKTRRDILLYGLWVGALCLAGLAVFYFIPTAVPPMVDAPHSSAFSLLQRLDATGNACPSMHVAAAVFTVMRVDAVLRESRSPAFMRFLNATCCALICYSTLAIKQHVALDVLAGAALGVTFAVLSLRQPRQAF